MSFTPGVSVKVPELPRVVRRAVVYQPDFVGSGRTTGLPADWNIGSNPLVRYR